jgi:hypothetical protein
MFVFRPVTLEGRSIFGYSGEQQAPHTRIFIRFEMGRGRAA